LEPSGKHGAKIRRWLGAGCVLALMCGCASPALGQAPATDSKTSGSTKAKTAKPTTARSTPTKTKTGANSAKASPKKHATIAAKGTRSSSTAHAKPHTASHPAAGQHSKSSTVAAAHSSTSKYASAGKNGKKRKTARGQQKIDPERAQAIQEALIREHYLSGEPAGTWNQTSEDAMRRYQADHGWQSKEVPDSRALISLGLGPSHEHLLNPESAMTTGPAAPRSETSTPVSHSADPGTRLNSTSPAPQAPAVTTPQPESPGPQ
jgi:hypothetical protein